MNDPAGSRRPRAPFRARRRGRWLDLEHHRVITGPAMLKRYHASLAQTPVFIRLGSRQTGTLMRAFSGAAYR